MGRLGGRGMLADPVVVAAFVFAHVTVALERDGAGDHVVQEGAIVAHQKDGAGVFGQFFFEQFECFGIEIVGGFVEDQYVRRLGEHARQQQAVALAA